MTNDNKKSKVDESDQEDLTAEPSNKKMHSRRSPLAIWKDMCKKIACSPTDFLELRPLEYIFEKELKLLDTREQKRLLDYLFDNLAAGYRKSFYNDVQIYIRHYQEAIAIIKRLQANLPQTGSIVLKWKLEPRHMLPLLIHALVKAEYIEGKTYNALAAFQQIFSEEKIGGASGRSAINNACKAENDEAYEKKIDDFTNKLNEILNKIRKDRGIKKQ